MSHPAALTDMGTDGFPELVYAMYDALVDLLGDQFDIDHEALAPELADVAWQQIRAHDEKAASKSEEQQLLPCMRCGADYNEPCRPTCPLSTTTDGAA